jgi:hypothetical protein
MMMKIEDVPVELKDKAEFACKVCRAKYRAETSKTDNCSCRNVLNEYCPYVEQVLAQESASKT